MVAQKTPAAEPKPLPAQDTPFREMIRVFGLLERHMQPYFTQFGISGAQWGVLRNLQRAETAGLAGLRLTDLSERLLIRPPSVTGVVDRLERAGLVQRAGDATDLRAKQVRLTAKGRQIVERVLEEHPGQIESLLSGLSKDEQSNLAGLLYKLRVHLLMLG